MPPLPALSIEAIEATQVIQNLSHDVILVNGKTTFIRVYLKSLNNLYIHNVSGFAELTTLPKDGKQIRIECASVGDIDISPFTEMLALRKDWEKSLNFILPDDIFETNKFDLSKIIKMKFTLKKLTKFNYTTKEEVEIEDIQGKRSLQIDFVVATNLGIRLVGYRNLDPVAQQEYLPNESEYREISMFIDASFPIAVLKCTAITIDAPQEFNNLRRITQRSVNTEEKVDRLYSILFQHLLAVRTQDLSQNLIQNLAEPNPPAENCDDEDKQFINFYLGILTDPSARFGGAAMITPTFPSADMVAFAEPDPDGVLAAHELAHLLGRSHPGIPSSDIHGKIIGQSNQEPHRQSPNIHRLGYISNDMVNDMKIVLGIDTRRSKSRPEIVQHDENFDLMTYRHPQWVSQYTYEKLYNRLVKIQEQTTSNPENKNNLWSVIGEYDLINQTGVIKYILPSSLNVTERRKEEQPEHSRITLKVYLHDYKQGETAYEVINVLTKNSSTTDTNPKLGIFHETISWNKKNDPRNYFPDVVVLCIDKYDVDVHQLRGPIKHFLDEGWIVKRENLQNSWILNENNSQGINDTTVAEKSLCSQNSSSDKPKQEPFSLQYSLDHNSFFFDYNWTDPNDLKNSGNAISNINPVLVNILSYVLKENLSLVTTVQFKRNSNLNSEQKNKPNWDPHFPIGGKWQTVMVSNRLRDSVWVSAVFTAKLKLATKSRLVGDEQEYYYNVNSISEFDCTEYSALGINFRILWTIGGFSFRIYETNSSKLCTKLTYMPKHERVILKASGSLGVDKLNYFRSVHDVDESKEKKYYKPGLDPNRSSECE